MMKLYGKAWFLSLFPLVAFNLMGCFYTTHSEKRMHTISVTSSPYRIQVQKKNDGQQSALGFTPTTFSFPYEVQRTQFNRGWLWGGGAFLGVTAGIGSYMFSTGRSNDSEVISGVGQGLLYGALALFSLSYTLYTIFNRTGEEIIPPQQGSIELFASQHGYLPEQTKIEIPTPRTSLHFVLKRDPAVELDHAPEEVAPESVFNPEKSTADYSAKEHTDTPIVVAIFDVLDGTRSLDKHTTEQLTEYLVSCMTRSGAYRIIPRQQLRTRLASEKKKSYHKCYDEVCQLELGKALAAEKSLAAKLIKVGNRCAVSATLYDLKTETAEKSAVHRCKCSIDELMDSMDIVCREFQ